MARHRSAGARREPAQGRGLTIAVVLLALVVAFLGWRWWQIRQPGASAGSVAVAPLGGADEVGPNASDAPAAAVAAAAAEPEPPRHPVTAPATGAESSGTPAATDARLGPALTALLGKPAIGKFLQIDDLARRVVTTVDNLARPEAPAARWPMQPAPGRFGATGEGEQRAIDPANSARYAPVVRFVESLDTTRIAALYREHYPLFQQTYEELGYPKRHFNDRLVAVIDHLLEAPEPVAPPHLTRVEIKGPYQDPRPWTRWEFADPELQALSSGQKMLVRMGLDNERRLKAKLAELRAAVAGGALATK